MLAILFLAYRIWKRRRQQLQDLQAAEVEAIVDARLGRATAAVDLPVSNGSVSNGAASNGSVANGHSPYFAPSTDVPGASAPGGRPTP